MAYRDYQSPGVNVIIEKQPTQEATQLTEFYPVFVGTGMTSRARDISETGITADVSTFPDITLNLDITGKINSQLVKLTDFSVKQLQIQKALSGGSNPSTLVSGTDYQVLSTNTVTTDGDFVQVKVKILNAGITATDLIYNLTLSAQNADDDFDLRLVSSLDRYYASDIFGPYKLNEDGNEFLNDIAIAAEIAFRMNVPYFYYLEVPREYGEVATKEEVIEVMEKIYFKDNAHRIVPLSLDADVANALNSFTTSVSNPVDRRETVGMVSYDPAKITNIKDIDELVQKVGGFSESLDNKRVCNVFGGESVELVISGERYVLPMCFMNVAVMCMDTTVGMADPLSLREITVFAKLNGPRFRPRQWDLLAKRGVFIVYQNDESEPITIRHQLTTAQSANAEDQEYSIVKNFDAVTKRLRDRLRPYAGQSNINDGYLERLDGSLTSAIEEIKTLGLARSLTVTTPWALNTIGSGTDTQEVKRNLVTRLKMEPVYPANNLDVYLLV